MVAEGSQIPTNNLQYKNCIAANMGDISIAATGKIFHIFSYTVLMLKLCQFKWSSLLKKNARARQTAQK